MSYCARIKQDTEGYYIVTFPYLPKCFTYGNSYDHAKEMAKDVLEGWLWMHKAKGLPMPKQRKHKCNTKCVRIQLNTENPFRQNDPPLF